MQAEPSAKFFGHLSLPLNFAIHCDEVSQFANFLSEIAMIARSIFIVLILTYPTASEAKTRFEIYEGPKENLEGAGGTKIHKHEVDFWTNGSPPRSYEIIGIITDNRGKSNLKGKAIGSKSVAKMVIKAGGNAIIVLDQKSEVTGVIEGKDGHRPPKRLPRKCW